MAEARKLTLEPVVQTPRSMLSIPDNDNEVSATTLVVENMNCGGCMRSIERTLLGQPGVTSARCNLSAKRVTVAYDAEALGVEDLTKVLAGAGFKAAELATDKDLTERKRDSDLLRRLGVAGFAAANIMLISVAVWSGIASDMDQSVQTAFHWLSALIALPAVAYAGQPFFRSAATALSARRLNMDVPISLGVVLATGMSLFQTVRGSEHVYFDAAVTLLFFLLIGRFLDQRMRTRAAGAAANLAGLQATSATLVHPDGSTQRVPARLLEPGMMVLVAAGERIAVDGQVQKGTSDIDESLMNGETIPRTIKPGDTVYAGSINLSGPIEVETRAANENVLLVEISRLMETAEQSRGKYVRLADRAAAIYAPAVHGLSLATFLGWMALGQGWEASLTAAIAVLIITCPCALALAVPAVQVAAVSRLFGTGLVVKSGDALERLAEVDTVVFDKTGTLTLGEPVLRNDPPVEDHYLREAAGLALASRHPYARALVEAARRRGIEPVMLDGVKETPGAGLTAMTPEGERRLGSASWVGIEDEGVDLDGGLLWFRPARGPAVAFGFEDIVRSDAAETVKQLEKAGMQVEILSGDRESSVAAAAAVAGIGSWHAGQKPQQKLDHLAALKASGRHVLMVGDGLNDAPALAGTHASLSPVAAADISQAAADAVFQGSLLRPVLDAIAVARASRTMALQNFAIALGYNLIFVPMAIAGLVNPLIAAIAMSASSIAVTANAVRLRVRKLELQA